MSKDEIYTEITRLLHEESDELSREEFRELLQDVHENCADSLNALDEEDY